MTITELLKKHLAEYAANQAHVSTLRALADNIRTAAKRATALLRRDNLKESRDSIGEAEKCIAEAAELIATYPRLRGEGAYRDALEEYAEAKLFSAFLSGSSPEFPAAASISAEEYIGGLCDVTGELVRKAITEAGIVPVSRIEEYKKFVEEIAAELTKLGFQNKLRQKYDDVERNLQRLEQILYDLRLKR